MRLLARLLPLGTLLLDGDDGPTFASAGACELFGVADLEALRSHWPELSVQLGVGEWPRRSGDEPHCGRADLATPAGARSIRFEVHAMAGARRDRTVLVRDRARILPSDLPLLLASEAQANRHVLNGLVHAAKGPLNNFHLTLALLAAGAVRSDASLPDVLARRKRYVDVLQSEVARLSACLDEIHALTLPHDPLPAAIDLAAMSRDCARVLRHGATMREVRLDVDAPDTPVIAFGDTQLVRLALLSLAIAMIELTSANGRVGWRVSACDGAPASIVLDTTEPALPSGLCAALFRLSCTAGSEHACAIAARLVIEAQRGEVILQNSGDGRRAILLRIPARD
jgi:signal transduction histidine kinase